MENDSNRIVVDSNNNVLPCFEILVKPPFGFGGNPVSVKSVPLIPSGSNVLVTSTGFFGDDSQYNSGGFVRYYFYYDPLRDVIFRHSDPRNNSGIRYFNILRDYFVNSSAYKQYAFLRNKNDFAPIIDLSSLFRDLIMALKAPLIMLLSIMITLQIVGAGFTKMTRGFEEKRSQRRLQQILSAPGTGIDSFDKLWVNEQLRDHAKEYRQRRRRYAREDRRRW